MDRMVKVFCSGSAQDRLSEKYSVVEKYDGFILAKVSQRGGRQLSREYPVEDITDLYAIPVGDRLIDTSRPRLDPEGKLRSHPAYKGVKPVSPEHHHYLVQFIGPIKDTWLKAVKRVGGEPRAPYADFTYVVRANDEALRRIVALRYVRWVGHLSHKDRLAPSISRTGRKPRGTAPSPQRPQALRGVYVVEFFSPENLKSALPGVKKLGFEIMEEVTNARILLVQARRSQTERPRALEDLAAIHGVSAIREWSVAQSCNDVAAGIMGTSMAIGRSGLGLSGKGEKIGVCDTGLDTGDPRTIHPDFAGRVAWIKSYPIRRNLASVFKNAGADDGPSDAYTGHGTHVAGSILGSGAASRRLKRMGLTGPVRGLAYRARLFFQAVGQRVELKDPDDGESYAYCNAGIPGNLGDLFREVYRRGVRIHSNSWSVKKGDGGSYTSLCEQLDRYVWQHKDFCVLVSAGNEGIESCDDGGHGTIRFKSIFPPGTSKNCITVGACENRRPNFDAETYGRHKPELYRSTRFKNDPMADNPDQIVPFSSRGPTQDGRVKPDVVASGTVNSLRRITSEWAKESISMCKAPSIFHRPIPVLTWFWTRACPRARSSSVRSTETFPRAGRHFTSTSCTTSKAAPSKSDPPGWCSTVWERPGSKGISPGDPAAYGRRQTSRSGPSSSAGSWTGS